MSEEKQAAPEKRVPFEIKFEKGVLRLEVDLEQKWGEPIALGILQKAMSLVTGYFVTKKMADQALREKTGILAPNGKMTVQ